MKAPDKIYVTISEMTELLATRRHDYDEVYIRKEALLEWAKKEQSKCSSDTHPYYMFLNVVIEKIQSL